MGNEDPAYVDKAVVDVVEDITTHHRRRDAAAEFLSKVPEGRIEVTPADNKRVLWRIDKVILPIMLTVYFLQALDKATLAYASVFGLIEDTRLVGNQYSWLGSIVYLAQLVMQFPLAWLLVRLPIAKFTSAMVLGWGVTLACMAAAHNFGGLLASRFFLGAFEASIAPSFIAITQMWWRRHEQTTRTSYWYAMNGITNMVSSQQRLHQSPCSAANMRNVVRKSIELWPRPHQVAVAERIPGTPFETVRCVRRQSLMDSGLR